MHWLKPAQVSGFGENSQDGQLLLGNDELLAYRFICFISIHPGPAISEIMQLIERNEIKGEEAASLIAVLPKTIREPTEEVQRRFLVSIFS